MQLSPLVFTKILGRQICFLKTDFSSFLLFLTFGVRPREWTYCFEKFVKVGNMSFHWLWNSYKRCVLLWRFLHRRSCYSLEHRKRSCFLLFYQSSTLPYQVQNCCSVANSNLCLSFYPARYHLADLVHSSMRCPWSRIRWAASFVVTLGPDSSKIVAGFVPLFSKTYSFSSW